MLQTAFTLLGTAVSWLELLAFVLALANIACNVAEIHWGWPLTIVASLLYAWLFYASKLYGEAGVNIFFAVTGVWGWWQWLRGHRGESGAPLRIAQLDLRGLLWCVAGFALAWLLLGLLLRGVTDSDVPWADGLVTASSLVGTLLLGRKFIENWPVWLAVNAASVALFAYKGLHLTVVLYVIFFLLAIWGWLGWKKRMTGAKIVVSTAKIVMPGPGICHCGLDPQSSICHPGPDPGSSATPPLDCGSSPQ